MMDPFNNVYPTLVECFGIILIGYLCGHINILTENQANGIQIYISRVALPAIIFKSMVELDFSQVNWAFWFGILTAKAALFTFVLLFTLALSKPVSENFGKAGLFAIFVTQSNDLALGLPLFDALFKSSHPEYLQYIYLLIPVSIALLNPIGLIMLELNKTSSNKDKKVGKCKLILNTLKGVITNPLVYMVVIGLIVNQVFTACKFDKKDWFLTPFLKVLAESFSATALFYLGISLVGNMKKYRGFDLVLPFLLVACKSLILPMMTRQAVSWFKSNSSSDATMMHNNSNIHAPECLPSFAFIYGTLPTAPTVVLFATMYNVQIDTIGTSMVLGTLLSAPIMFVSSKMISMMQSTAKEEIDKAFAKTIFDIGILSSICCLWVFAVFILTKFHKRPLHQFTMCLIFMQLMSSLAVVISENSPTKLVLSLFITGLVGSNCWTALLAYSLSTVRCRGEKIILKLRPVIFAIGITLPLCIGLSLTLTESGSEHLSTNHKTNPFLVYMRLNKYFSMTHAILMMISVTMTIVCLIILQRCDKYCRCKGSKIEERRQSILNGEKSSTERPQMCRQCKTLCQNQKQFDIEDLPPNSCCRAGEDSPCLGEDGKNMENESYKRNKAETIKVATTNSFGYGSISPVSDVNEETFDGIKDIEEMTLDDYFQGDRHQLSRHIILILFLSFFSILNIFLCFERVFGDSDDHKTGIFTEIEFLAVVCSLGQGFISFAVFGFNKMFFNLISFERFGLLQPGCVGKKIHLEPTLDPATIQLCLRFKVHHQENCQKDLVKDLRFHFRTYKNVFQGDKLVDWLIEFGLANTRMDAVHYGNCLLKGRVIQHCVQEHYFYDLPYFYCFYSDEK